MAERGKTSTLRLLVQATGYRLIGTWRNFCNNLRVADQPPGISVSLQVENKQFIGNRHLIGSSPR